MLITAILRVLYNAVGTPFEVDSNTANATTYVTIINSDSNNLDVDENHHSIA